MVGRGPTGARVLVLSVLIVLTAEGCRGQKGWCHTSATITGGRQRHASRFCCSSESLRFPLGTAVLK
ncbi:hypothetical protein GOODEAATRI_017927 [Goodea atripinnis]|uniref:Secreted protein n=1 Tax=Goodea atripinnis TaxID=208336 RepID=A0ABV0P5T0_9TELE